MSGGGFGNTWGGNAFGGAQAGGIPPVNASETVSLTEVVSVYLPLKLESAVVLGPYLIRLYFSHDLDPGYAANFQVSSYSILPTLGVYGVTAGPTANSVDVVTGEQGATTYTITVSDAQSATGDAIDPTNNSASFLGFPIAPNFFAAAQSRTKVEVVFSTSMLQDANFTNTANYTLQAVDGTTIGISSVTASGPTPISRVTLALSTSLVPDGYYALRIDPSVKTAAGLSLTPDTDVFHWGEMSAPILVGPLSIPIRNFSGEVTGGILGAPAGQVFFSPSLDVAAPNSSIQVDDVSVCTRAYDTYSFPNPPDPQPFFTFGGPISSVLGQNVLWAPAERLGQAHIELSDFQTETMPAAADGPADATLVEPIDITRAGFLNDSRWGLYDGIVQSFITADNLTPIGAGPTTNINLEP